MAKKTIEEVIEGKTEDEMFELEVAYHNFDNLGDFLEETLASLLELPDEELKAKFRQAVEAWFFWAMLGEYGDGKKLDPDSPSFRTQLQKRVKLHAERARVNAIFTKPLEQVKEEYRNRKRIR